MIGEEKILDAFIATGQITKEEIAEIRNNLEMETIKIINNRITENIELTCKRYLSDSNTFKFLLENEMKRKRENGDKYYLIKAGTGLGKTQHL